MVLLHLSAGMLTQALAPELIQVKFAAWIGVYLAAGPNGPLRSDGKNDGTAA
jgi:hypothetical protein